MALDFQGLTWMPSPPLAPMPEAAPIDTVHLAAMTLGDRTLEREVLAMFAAQSATLAQRLAGRPADGAGLAHKLKGSARAIGAFDVADAAGALETALQSGAGIDAAQAVLRDAVQVARAAIDALLMRS